MKFLFALLLLLAPTQALAQEPKKPQSMRDAAESFRICRTILKEDRDRSAGRRVAQAWIDSAPSGAEERLPRRELMESMVEAVSAMLYNERTLSPDQSSALWKSFGTDHADRPAGNISPRKGRKDYRLFYTDKTRELAEKRFAPECALLGYDFDGPTDSAALLFNNEKADDCPGFDIDFRDRR